jgi:hypothetical protein
VASLGTRASGGDEGEEGELDMAGMVVSWPCGGLPRVPLRVAMLH